MNHFLHWVSGFSAAMCLASVSRGYVPLATCSGMASALLFLAARRVARKVREANLHHLGNLLARGESLQ